MEEMTVKTSDHILPQEHWMLREAGTKSSTPLSLHVLQQYLRNSDVLGPACAKALSRPTNTVVFSWIILQCQYADIHIPKLI